MMLLLPLLVFLLFTGSIGAVLVAVFYPYISRSSAIDRRIQSLSRQPPGRGITEKARKRSVDEILREAEEKKKARAKKRVRTTLLVRLRQADLGWSRKVYYLIGATAAITCFAVMRLGVGTLPAAGFGFAAGLLLPHLYVNFRRTRRFKRFSAQFPNALDVIVRGTKSGLPLIECVKIVATEAQEPVRGEFKAIVEDQVMGMPLEQAVERLPERVPLSEASFFAIVMAMQSQSGGSLSEALTNLSAVLRERMKMKGRVKALSSESKSSAIIIAAMPVLVTGMIYLTAPQYISLLFATQIGQVVLVGSALWMLIGSLLMRKMINFDF